MGNQMIWRLMLLTGMAIVGNGAQPVPQTLMNRLAFAPDGTVSSLVLDAGGTNLVNLASPGQGFYLETWTVNGLKQYRLDRVRWEGAALVVSRETLLPRFTFEVTAAPRYLALKLKRVEGLPCNQITLHLDVRCRADVVMQGLDYVMNTKPRRDRDLKADWNYLGQRNARNPLGGIALYAAGTPEQEDDALLDVWVNEDLPKPAIQEPWTRERASRWLDEFARLYSDQTRMIIAAGSPEELYAMTDFAQRAGVKQVYLHTDTWRGEYWPQRNSHIHVNPKVFPAGLADLKKYTAHLRERGMFLALHTTSGGIGPYDPRRIADRVSRDLTSWGTGTLEDALTPEATTVRFRPAPGTGYPFIARYNAGQPGNVAHFFKTGFMRVGEEIFKVGAFQDTDCEVWLLTGCRRGIGATKPAAHEKGQALAGLLSAYGQNFTPEVDSPLFEEMAKEYADFANAIGLGRLEYDALEIHDYPRWGVPKYTERVARQLDHPVITGSSGGCSVWGNVEVLFNRYKHLSASGGAHASFILETGSRRATTELDFNTGIAKAIAEGQNKLSLNKSQAMFGINLEMLETHGLSGQFLDDFKRWHAVLERITPDQRRELSQLFEDNSGGKRTLINPGAGSGHVGMLVRETPEAYQLVPVAVMVRPEDAPWMVGTESAAVAPRQFVELGQTLQLRNPYAAQPPSWTIRVLPETVEACSTNGVRRAAGGDSLPGNYLTGVASAGREVQARPLPPGVAGKTVIQPKADEVRNQRHASVTQEGDGVIVSADNPRNEAQWQADDLPDWREAAVMPGHGLAMDVTGDGSGALLVVQLSGRGERDYVVKIGFSGRRKIVIPTGEVSWADGNWGRRPGTERFGYNTISGVAMGFGMIPARTSPRVKVENLRLLEDRPGELVNPVVAIGAGEVRVAGTVASGQYLRYAGGDQATVYDENWKQVKSLPVTRRGYCMPTGLAPVSVRADEGGTHPWLEVQFFSEGRAISISK